MATEKFYWLDKWEGEGVGGVYWRGFEFVNFIRETEKQLNCKIVGIKIDDTYNVEFIRDDLGKEDENESSKETENIE